MVPLKAYQPEALLELPEVINFGEAQLNQTVSRIIEVVNRGKRRTDCIVRIGETDDVSVTPNRFSLK